MWDGRHSASFRRYEQMAIMKYPIGIQTFEQLIEDGYVYVDKTDLVYRLVTQGKIYFLSRPRRFGKSILVSTLKSYFLGKRELFRGLKIENMEKEWNVHPVFVLSFGTGDYTRPGTLEESLNQFITNAEKIYGADPTVTDYGRRFQSVLRAASEKTGRRAVVLVDEYDKPLLDVLGHEGLCYTGEDGNKTSLEEHHRNVLKGFYGVFKDADEYLQFVLLTGVTKFSQISVFSGFNQPDDISMDARYEALCGITKEELLTVFDESIRQLAESEGTSHDAIVDRLTDMYDGYHFSEKMLDIFNPFSILNCFNKQSFRAYWFASGTPTYLIRLLNHCRVNINELVGRYYDLPMFVDYRADVERPLPMLYQSGYLTIKGCAPRRQAYLLDFPNQEVRNGLMSALSANYFAKQQSCSSNWIFDISDDLEMGCAEQFIIKMRSLLSSVSYRLLRKDIPMEAERHFHAAFYLILQMIGCYNTYIEKETSEGSIDCVIECPGYIYVIELKMDRTADEAVQQIFSKGYLKPYRGDVRQLFALGINFSSQTGTIEEYRILTGEELC